MGRNVDQEKNIPFLEGAEGESTRAVHGGEYANSSSAPIFMANTVDDFYTRSNNPTIKAFENKFRELDRSISCIATSSGMAAISQVLLGLLKSGDRIIVHEQLFIGSRTLFEDFLPNYGIAVVAMNINDLEQLSKNLDTPTQAVFFETISHPQMNVINVPEVMKIIKQKKALSIVDNTCLTPLLFNPFEFGVDVVIHSATKFIGGHGDSLGGIISVQDAALGERIRKSRRILGGVMSPMNASFLHRGLKTLPLRLKTHCANALSIATFLEKHPHVREVNYPGLSSSPDYQTAAGFMKSSGGLLSFKLSEGANAARFVETLKVIEKKFSFGEPSTLILLYEKSDHIRIAAGLEDIDDLTDDLNRALNASVSG